MPELDRIRQIIKSAGRRVRIQRILDSMTYGLTALFVVLLTLVTAFELGLVDGELFESIYLPSFALPLLAVIIAGLFPVDRLSVARTIDEKHGLKDRVSSAWAFAKANEPSPFEQAQIRDTVRKLEGLSVKHATPFKTPRGWKVPALIFLLFTAAMIVRLPDLPSIESSAEARQRALQYQATVSADQAVSDDATAALEQAQDPNPEP